MIVYGCQKKEGETDLDRIDKRLFLKDPKKDSHQRGWGGEETPKKNEVNYTSHTYICKETF